MEKIMAKPKVDIYTDGACSGNPGNGGWGAVLIYNGTQKEMSGAVENTTNNQMELLACIQALKALKQPCKVDLYSDSAYVVNCFLQGWITNWKLNGWKGANKKPVKNIELWQTLDQLCFIHEITWHKVKGHADNVFNNRCDQLATSAILLLNGEHN